MLRLAVPTLLALGLLVASTQRTAEAHIPPPAFLKLEVADDHTVVLVAVAFDVFSLWFTFEARDLAADGSLTPKQREAVEAVFAKCLRVQVDGLAATGKLQDAAIERFEDHMRMWTYVNLRVRYETTVPPRQVAFVWQGYASDTSFVFDDMDAELEAYGELSFPKFRKQEPEYIWHRPVGAVKPAPVVLPQAVEPPHVTVPLVSAGLVLTLLVCALCWRRRYDRWRLAVAVVVCGISAFQLRNVAPLNVPLPGDHALLRPPDADALTIFASLHRGVYTAMERDDEDAVYDQLADNVTGELLPGLYLAIRQSMILQEEGGAIAKIQKTEILESAILDEREEGAPWFKVHARWQVVGRVGHWGHTHQRINEYLADATVVAKDGHWKIARIDVLEETRVDDGEEAR